MGPATVLPERPFDPICILRWKVERFVRRIKWILGCRYLPAESQQGATIHVYLTLIAALLLAKFLAKKPNRPQMKLLPLFILGFCSLEELCEALKIGEKEI